MEEQAQYITGDVSVEAVGRFAIATGQMVPEIAMKKKGHQVKFKWDSDACQCNAGRAVGKDKALTTTIRKWFGHGGEM